MKKNYNTKEVTGSINELVDYYVRRSDWFDKLHANTKDRIAKVVDITGEPITLVYGDYFYIHQYAVINSIKYGRLRISSLEILLVQRKT